MDSDECNHGITFDEDKVKGQRLSCYQIREMYPRGWFTQDKPCPNCGYVGIYYASFAHYAYGDW